MPPPTTTPYQWSDETTTNDVAKEDDTHKLFLTRIPQSFNASSLRTLLEAKYGNGCVTDVAIMEETEMPIPHETSRISKRRKHRGFAFITMNSLELRDMVVKDETVHGVMENQKEYTMIVRPVNRPADHDEEIPTEPKVCYLWQQYKCPYGTTCQFLHDGEGGLQEPKAKSLMKCFMFKKKGRCKLGDECPYLHVKSTQSEGNDTKTVEGKSKGCISWKMKGKCRKKEQNKCPYTHEEGIRLEALARKKTRQDQTNSDTPKRQLENEDSENTTKRTKTVPQPLSITLFNVSVETTKDELKTYFQTHCGPVMDVLLQTTDTAKGISERGCNVLFQSPKAVAKACLLNDSAGGEEDWNHGMIARIEEGDVLGWRKKRGGTTSTTTSKD